MIFQQSLYSQKEIVGKVEFYKSKATEFVLFRDKDDLYTKNLNKRKSKIKLFQRDSIKEIETNSSGVFVLKTTLKDSIRIIVNEHSPVFNGQFEFDFNEINDTLKLRISDKKLAIKLDSQLEPEFYNKYSENQANVDFANGKRIILAVGIDWRTDESTKIIKEITELYNVNYKYIFDPSQSEMRILYRYNEVMKKLMGINKNVW
ncbi:hypothetical protein A7A78_02105 [Aequorivita soesokkakensis]|uniref:Uncharacterized protein n=1 Tax=Aequorivita soesokkakensis TaxID=1385699 RepID=A0A1A9LJN8_9FLAO|nr:hypothetical protein A7A78_02105 [Aequorivita soesokkakensis]